MRSAVGVLAALGLLLGSWSLTHHLVPKKKLLEDTVVYEKYGDGVVRGKVPYRDFKPEYPPGSLPVFILPSLIAPRHHLRDYTRWFDREMAVCAVLALLGVVLITRTPPALAIVGTAPLLLGPVVLTRFDYLPAALTVLALAAFLRERLTTAAVLVGVAIGVKLWPAVVVPVWLLHLWRTRGARATATFAGIAIAIVAAIFVPFAVIAPDGLAHSFHRQLGRPIQIESLGGAALIAIHRFFGTIIGTQSSFGSQNLVGTGTHAAALVTTILLLVALVVAWVVCRDVVAGTAATVAAFIAFGKVFSPQFMIWLVPLVPLVPSIAAWTLLVFALLLTQSWFPADYWNLVNSLAARESLELVVRDVTVVALFVLLTWKAARRAPAPQRVSAAEAERGRPAAAARRAA
jgi:uncharacterized membrane protein